MEQHAPAPPHDLELERGIIAGAVIHGADVVGRAAELIRPDDFHDRRHQALWLALNQLWDQGQPVDELTLLAYLRDSSQLDTAGGPEYLAGLVGLMVSPAHVEHYAGAVREKATLRRMLASLDDARRAVFRNLPSDQVLADVQSRVNDLAKQARPGDMVATGDLLGGVYEALAQRQAQQGDPWSVPWGLPALDAKIGGMERGDFIVVAGRPGMGKSSFALRVAINVAREGWPVLFCSREQTAAQLGSWLVCSECGVDTQHWRLGRLTAGELAKVRFNRELLSRLPIHWLCGKADLRGIEARARAIKARDGGLGLVVVDYLQRYARSKQYDDVSELSNRVKDAAGELEVPFLVPTQLSRKVEEREPPKPVMSDIKNSGDIEQDANVILLLYRPAYYRRAEDGEESLVKVAIGKNRGGPTGVTELHFNAPTVRFHDAQEIPDQREMWG